MAKLWILLLTLLTANSTPAMQCGSGSGKGPKAHLSSSDAYLDLFAPPLGKGLHFKFRSTESPREQTLTELYPQFPSYRPARVYSTYLLQGPLKILVPGGQHLSAEVLDRTANFIQLSLIEIQKAALQEGYEVPLGLSYSLDLTHLGQRIRPTFHFDPRTNSIQFNSIENRVHRSALNRNWRYGSIRIPLPFTFIQLLGREIGNSFAYYNMPSYNSSITHSTLRLGFATYFSWLATGQPRNLREALRSSPSYYEALELIRQRTPENASRFIAEFLMNLREASEQDAGPQGLRFFEGLTRLAVSEVGAYLDVTLRDFVVFYAQRFITFEKTMENSYRVLLETLEQIAVAEGLDLNS